MNVNQLRNSYLAHMMSKKRKKVDTRVIPKPNKDKVMRIPTIFESDNIAPKRLIPPGTWKLKRMPKAT